MERYKKELIEKVTVEVDVALEGSNSTIVNEVKKYAKNCTVKLVSFSGPGGGFPIVQITGEEKDVRNYLLAAGYIEDRNEDIEYLLV